MTDIKFNCTLFSSDYMTVETSTYLGPRFDLMEGGEQSFVRISAEDAIALATHLLITYADHLTPEEADGIRSELPQHEAGSSLPAAEHVIPPHKEIIFNDCGAYLTRGGSFYTLNNAAGHGGAHMTGMILKDFAKAIAEHAGLKLADPDEQAPEAKPTNPNPRLSNLSSQAQLVYQHMARAGSISARDAFDDHGITSATLSRRICDIEEEGFKVERESKKHPITERRYTRYSLKDQPPLALPYYPE